MVVTLKLISTAVCYQDGLAPPKVLACLCSSCKRVAVAFGGHSCFDRVLACAVRRPVLARGAWLQDSANIGVVFARRLLRTQECMQGMPLWCALMRVHALHVL